MLIGWFTWTPRTWGSNLQPTWSSRTGESGRGGAAPVLPRDTYTNAQRTFPSGSATMSSASTSPGWSSTHAGSPSIRIFFRFGGTPRIFTVPRTVPGLIASVGTIEGSATGFGGGGRG